MPRPNPPLLAPCFHHMDSTDPGNCCGVEPVPYWHVPTNTDEPDLAKSLY